LKVLNRCLQVTYGQAPAPVYLKRSRRAAGLVHPEFLGMMLDALIEPFFAWQWLD
jgi:hypothetical protein